MNDVLKNFTVNLGGVRAVKELKTDGFFGDITFTGGSLIAADLWVADGFAEVHEAQVTFDRTNLQSSKIWVFGGTLQFNGPSDEPMHVAVNELYVSSSTVEFNQVRADMSSIRSNGNIFFTDSILFGEEVSLVGIVRHGNLTFSGNEAQLLATNLNISGFSIKLENGANARIIDTFSLSGDLVVSSGSQVGVGNLLKVVGGSVEIEGDSSVAVGAMDAAPEGTLEIRPGGKVEMRGSLAVDFLNIERDKLQNSAGELVLQGLVGGGFFRPDVQTKLHNHGALTLCSSSELWGEYQQAEDGVLVREIDTFSPTEPTISLTFAVLSVHGNGPNRRAVSRHMR